MASDEESDESELEEKRPVGFAFLADSDSDDSDSDSDSDASDKEESECDADEEEEEEAAKPAPAPVQHVSASKYAHLSVFACDHKYMSRPLIRVACECRRNKKQRGKKSDNPGDAGSDNDDDDDVDDILDALVAEAGGLSVDATQRSESENALLSVQLGFINADKEMKRIFGVRLAHSLANRTLMRR